MKRGSSSKIKKGDKVKVLLGKDRGKTGTVQSILGKERRVFVEGVNIYKRHVRKMGNMKGGILDIPKSMDVSNVALICPSCDKQTRVGYKLQDDTKVGSLFHKVRICKKCKKDIRDAKA